MNRLYEIKNDKDFNKNNFFGIFKNIINFCSVEYLLAIVDVLAVEFLLN